MGFMVNKMVLEQVFSEYFDFSCQFSFHQLLHTHLSSPSGTGIVGPLVAGVASGLTNQLVNLKLTKCLLLHVAHTSSKCKELNKLVIGYRSIQKWFKNGPEILVISRRVKRMIDRTAIQMLV
jgi:hypothetical protein